MATTATNIATGQLPTEVLQNLYSYLSPAEFDSARHVCRSWYVSSLDRGLLKSMLRALRFSSSCLADLESRDAEWSRRAKVLQAHEDHKGLEIEDCHQPEINDMISEEWLLSKRLATECKLSANWLSASPQAEASDRSLERMIQVGSVDFAGFVGQLGMKNPSSASVNVFTISACGKFVLLIRGGMVYVYGLDGNIVSPLASISCPRRALAVSMDTSSQRFAVGVLLEGRAGMSVSLGNEDIGEPMRLGLSTDVHGAAVQTTPALFGRSTGYVNPTSPGTWLDTGLQRFESPRSSITGLPLESGQKTVYNNLCSVDDPPRSVAICPQRRCVAFGCRMGIELHWVDALTGSDLNRWFPLAAPSDHLYFLPKRTDITTGSRKLRLISSASEPEEIRKSRSGTPAARRNRYTLEGDGTDSGERQSVARTFLGNLPFSGGSLTAAAPHEQPPPDGVFRAIDCDHYRAIPLSDGIHLLFTDPETGYLCLGSDAPLGGRTKLLRKCVCARDEKLVGYAAGQDLSWGVRLVAAYADGSVVLYSIPSDTFRDLCVRNATLDSRWNDIAGVLGPSDLSADALLTNDDDAPTYSRATNSEVEEAGNDAAARTWPIHLKGAEIARFDIEVAALAVDSANGGLRVWVFGSDAVVRIFDVYDPGTGAITQSVVRNDGLVERIGVVGPTSVIGEGAKVEGKQRGDGPRVHFRGLDGSDDESATRTHGGTARRGFGQQGSARSWMSAQCGSAHAPTTLTTAPLSMTDEQQVPHQRWQIQILSDRRRQLPSGLETVFLE